MWYAMEVKITTERKTNKITKVEKGGGASSELDQNQARATQPTFPLGFVARRTQSSALHAEKFGKWKPEVGKQMAAAMR